MLDREKHQLSGKLRCQRKHHKVLHRLILIQKQSKHSGYFVFILLMKGLRAIEDSDLLRIPQLIRTELS